MILCTYEYFELLKETRFGKYLIRIYFDKKAKKTACFYVSEKQYKNLLGTESDIFRSRVKGYPLGVFDEDRFVWSGIEYRDHSDREWLKKTFQATEVSKYEFSEEIIKHSPEIINPGTVLPNKELIKDEFT